MQIPQLIEEVYQVQEPPWRCAFCYGVFATEENLARFGVKSFHLICLRPMLEAQGIPEAVLLSKRGEKQTVLGYQPRYPYPEN